MSFESACSPCLRRRHRRRYKRPPQRILLDHFPHDEAFGPLILTSPFADSKNSAASFSGGGFDLVFFLGIFKMEDMEVDPLHLCSSAKRESSFRNI